MVPIFNFTNGNDMLHHCLQCLIAIAFVADCFLFRFLFVVIGAVDWSKL
jgi:hypothetical protein